VIGLLLGAFALAGDRLGLWEPIAPARMSVQVDDGRIGSRPTGLAENASSDRSAAYLDQARQPPSPPLPARTAFISSTVAAAIALLLIAATKLVKIVRRGRSTLFVPARETSFSPGNGVEGALRRRDRTASKRVVQTLVVMSTAMSGTAVRAMARAITVAARTRPVAFHFGIGPEARQDVTLYLLAVVLAVAVGLLAALGTR
jgi:hypothetical protein